MLDKQQRYYCERIRNARSIRIVIGDGTGDECDIVLRNIGEDGSLFRKLLGMLRFSLQDYFNSFNHDSRKFVLGDRRTGGRSGDARLGKRLSL